MHLRAIKLRGFKSFPDPVEVRLQPGVAVVVGPNGSGKSNIADALIWAAGSLAPTELRAEKPDDVLFAGSANRAAADHCEVELVFDNEDGALAELDFTEVSIVRRLHRGGEGQYLVNGAHVRRTDVVELLSDVGLGQAMGSIVSQGRVEAILASKPEERRMLVEEAAGLGRFKRRRHRAELKLARVATQVERARDVEAEVAKRLRPLALQATAAERAEKLGVEIASLRAGIAAIDMRTLDDQIAGGGGRRKGFSEERARAEAALEALLVERGRGEDALAEAAGGREGPAATLYRLRSGSERLELRRESAEGLLERLRETPPLLDAGLLEQARLADARAAALGRAIAEREGLPPAARALAEEGALLALDQVEVEPGYERAVAAAVGAALIAGTPAEGLALLESARERGLGNLIVLVRGERVQPLGGIEVVGVHELLAARGPAVTLEGHFFDPARGVLSFTGDTAEAVLLELEAQRRRLLAESAALAERANQAVPRSADPRLVAAAASLISCLEDARRAAERLQAPLLEESDRGAVRAGELAAELRALGGREVELRRALTEASERVSGVDVELARLEAEREEAERRFRQAGDGEPADGAREELAEKLERLERRREQLGGVNPFAKEEYAAEKERLSELRTQRDDLERSLVELQKLRDELTETVDRRFTETFDAVQKNFAEVASTLFPGGKGRLRLTEPEEDGGEHGIEVELSPAGKRITRLSLLSGGEKALGAISFLFALFLARPCPFYLLDEVEAALDDTNIGRFTGLLRQYADRAQFIVVTHQKRTMEAADALYGVTMGGDGVSQVVSRQLPQGKTPSPFLLPSRRAVMARTWSDLLGGGEGSGETPEQQVGFFGRLRDSLSKSRRALTQQFEGFDPNDEEAWERVEEALIGADVGVPATAELVRRLEEQGGLDDLPAQVASLLGEPGTLNVAARPSVVLVVGVNGTGKTTTIGKLAAKLHEHGLSVLLAAADTFRAAAEEQLEIWAERAQADFVGAPRGGDPAAVAYDAIEAATARGRDVVIVDTAGRLHTQTNLMEELVKVRRVIAGKLEGAPHETLLVVDATTGQNGLQQARLFGEAVGVTGVALTKLDGSAKGGIAVAIAHELGLPVKLVGVGEGLDDLRPFDPGDFARALVSE